MFRLGSITALVVFVSINFAHASQQYQSYIALYSPSGRLQSVVASNEVYNGTAACQKAADAHVQRAKNTTKNMGTLIRYSDYAYKATDGTGYIKWACLTRGSESYQFFPKQWDDNIAASWTLVKN